jgi:hypothetical protein
MLADDLASVAADSTEPTGSTRLVVASSGSAVLDPHTLLVADVDRVLVGRAIAHLAGPRRAVVVLIASTPTRTRHTPRSHLGLVDLATPPLTPRPHQPLPPTYAIP